ncbi:unnamed protein product [Caenorhabditis auriculariae]|uniref:ShKT domain-containing protein n=1 Tax=Caenorhabditis auriculariae TaxID=2777116 RepID=A0A8S1HGI3_9PELO|nr:unnamed protein product [Caenorhabditis auriculariae]
MKPRHLVPSRGKIDYREVGQKAGKKLGDDKKCVCYGPLPQEHQSTRHTPDDRCARPGRMENVWSTLNNTSRTWIIKVSKRKANPFSMISNIQLISIAVIFKSVQASTAFTCTQLDANVMQPNNTVTLPANSSEAVAVPANFSCTYRFLVRGPSFLMINVTHRLMDRDQIILIDAQNYTKQIDSTETVNYQFYASTGEGRIVINTGSSGGSKALLQLHWFTVAQVEKVWKVHPNRQGVFLDANSLRLQPQTVSSSFSDGKVALAIAQTGLAEPFDSFFVFEGQNISDSFSRRLSSYTSSNPLISKTSTLTIVGLSPVSFHSYIIALEYSNIQSFDQYRSYTVLPSGLNGAVESLDVKTAVTIFSPSTSNLYLTGLRYTEMGNVSCVVTGLSSTPSNSSKILLVYNPETTDDNCFPQHFPAGLFSFEVVGCSLNFSVVSNEPTGYYEVMEGRSGYVFTPSFLDPSAYSATNVTFNSNASLSYQTFVESVLVTKDEQLAVNVYTDTGKTAMSILVTGNQTGANAEGYGTTVNIAFRGDADNGSAKVRFAVGSALGELSSHLPAPLFYGPYKCFKSSIIFTIDIVSLPIHPIMSSIKIFGLYVLLALVFAVVLVSAEKCEDSEDGHCEVLSHFCGDSKWAHLTANCRKTCGFC